MADAWDMATLALRLLGVDPLLGGIWVRARSGPVRESLIAQANAQDTCIRLHPTMSDDALIGGLDLSATLSAGKIVSRKGLLANPATFMLPMAERMPQRMTAHLTQALDAQAGHTLIALDEGIDEEESLPAALIERLAFHVDLSGLPHNAAAIATEPTPPDTYAGIVTCSDDLAAQIVSVAAHLGIDSLRAPLFALRTAKALARIENRAAVTAEDVACACKMTLAHKATCLPEQPQQDKQPPPPNDQTDESDGPQTTDTALPEELLLAAVSAILPDNLLDRVQARVARGAKGSGAGATRKGNRRGRPLPSRKGRKTDGARIDLVATLRTAAPWQTIRKADATRDGLQIRAEDLRFKRFEEKSDRLIVFAVDASGSAALSRLAEAKGAVELLLAEAYARRDHVALVAFRGDGAETLLPPTRSLVQTKRRLADLPGGGGTPLAAGLIAAMEQAIAGRRKGMSPTVCLLTDGRANVARDGTGNRQQAGADAQDVARVLRQSGIEALVIDTGNRPEAALRTLAATLDAPYLPLPRADANRLSQAVAAALGD